MSLNDPNWGRNAGQKSDSDQGSRRPKNDGPPDLDELWRDFNRRLSSLFGGGGDSGNRGNRPGTPFGNPFGSDRNIGIGLGVLLGLSVVLWLGSGFYIVQEGQAAVVMRFGEFRELNSRAGFTCACHRQSRPTSWSTYSNCASSKSVTAATSRTRCSKSR